MAKTNAENCREYRLRKKKGKPVKKPMTNAERVRKFREKKRLKKIMEQNMKAIEPSTIIENRKLDDHQFNKAVDTSPSNDLIASILMPTKVKIPKTSTERSREYRERKRREKNGNENTKHEKSKKLGNEMHNGNSTNSSEKEHFKIVSKEPSIPIRRSILSAVIRTPIIAPENPKPIVVIRKLKKQDAGRSLLKLEDIPTQKSSERLHNNQIDTVFIKQQNIKMESEPDDDKCEIAFRNKQKMLSDMSNIDANNDTVNVKVENKTLKGEYLYELPVTKMEIQIKQEPYEKGEEVI